MAISSLLFYQPPSPPSGDVITQRQSRSCRGHIVKPYCCLRTEVTTRPKSLSKDYKLSWTEELSRAYGHHQLPSINWDKFEDIDDDIFQ
ncbi:hypothetical protein CRG98_004913, partial [Punica granatum]